MYKIFRKLHLRLLPFLKGFAWPRRHKAAATQKQPSVQRAFGIADITLSILERLKNKDLARCALVCRDWADIVHDILWKGRVDSGNMYVCFLQFYISHELIDFTQRMARLSGALSPTSWARFNESLYAGHIGVLDLNLRDLNCNSWFLAAMLDSIHSPMKLPVLNKLHVTVSQDAIELQLAMKFFSSNVTHFVADIARGYASAKGRRHHARMDSLIPVFRDPLDPQTSTLSTAYPLDEFFAAVHQQMPHIVILAVDVRDSDEGVDAFHSLVSMVLALKELTSLSLPPYNLGISLIAALSTHQTLRNIIAIGRNSTRGALRWDDSHAIVTQPVARLDGSSARLVGLAVTVPIHTFLSFFSNQFDLNNITSLHIIISEEVAASDTLRAAFSLIVDRCPYLENLTVSLAQSYDNPWHISYDVLAPLRKCERLVSLDISSTFTTDINEEEFEKLVSNWPKLQHLALDGPDAVPVSPEDQVSLSLGAVMNLLHKYCPLIFEYILLVSMTLQPKWFVNPGFCGRMNNLRAVTLLVDSPTATDIPQIAMYLKWVLPGQCKVNYHPAVHQTAPELHLREWEARRSALLAFTRELIQAVEKLSLGGARESYHTDLLWIIDLNLSTAQLV
ncbi:hypothetical protein EW026_g3546 [Hermanssonia centrifuga]|uniref:F-box domain-containing protein n=1 Tax=Hermanssonia centrifuga TaxID=98765 RepID=A0A4S4KKZ3_9APHY|nr:hypothetical protein EW026_g3546 [Hermanssonia centrifuga]